MVKLQKNTFTFRKKKKANNKAISKGYNLSQKLYSKLKSGTG